MQAVIGLYPNAACKVLNPFRFVDKRRSNASNLARSIIRRPLLLPPLH